MGCDVQVWDTRAECIKTRSRNCVDCQENGPEGRSKRELVYNVLQSRASRVILLNCLDT